MKLPVALTLFALAARIASGQTPPQKPNVTSIPTTPDLRLPGPPMPTEVGTAPLTADNAALIGLRLQPNVTVALAQAAAARAQVQVAISGLLPTASAASTYEWLLEFNLHNGQATSTTQRGLSSSLTLHQLIFDFDKTMDQVREA